MKYENFYGYRGIPSEIPQDTAAWQVVMLLGKCFQQGGLIIEPLLSELVWGFRQSGFPKERTVKGVEDLATLGYVALVALAPGVQVVTFLPKFRALFCTREDARQAEVVRAAHAGAEIVKAMPLTLVDLGEAK